ncbi:MAG: nicotinate-nucleotide--dimethylbenzimidazole phosphoribosyltransferase [Oceanobacter sp.]
MFSIPALNPDCLVEIRQRIDNQTKPPGSLGQLEALAAQLAQIQWHGADTRLSLSQPTMLVFAADHGIARHPVSIAPQAVTRQMVQNFLAGGAAINCFCQSSDMALQVVDAGILEPIDSTSPVLLQRRIGAGTEDFSVQAAMSSEQYQQALLSGAALGQQQVASGCQVLGFGEMGIGNTSSAAALLALATGQQAVDVVGRGTGIENEQLVLKRRLVEQAVARVKNAHKGYLDAATLLQEVGGFEIVQMIGTMLAAAEQRAVLLIDGFIVSVAALLACRLHPDVRDYMIFSHRSAEAAHWDVLQMLDAEPLLDMNLRLGEGTGAALALPLLRAACAFYNDMASFDSANIDVDIPDNHPVKPS